MAFNNASNYLLYNTAGLPEFKNPRFGKVAVNVSSVSGNQDLYVVPAGKRVFIYQIFSYFAANVAVNLSVKSGGTYYVIGATTAPGTVNSIVSLNAFPVILSGETIAFNTPSSVSGNLTLSYVEFDNDSQLNRGGLFSLASGNNTIYTCPTGYQALPSSFYMPIASRVNYNCCVNYFNLSGATRTLSFYYVPSGGSPGSTNLTWAGTIANNTSTLSLTNTSCFSAMQAGDSFVINTDSSASGQYAWVNVIERKL